MEEKQKFPTATGFSGKILIASLFIFHRTPFRDSAVCP